MFRMPRNRQLRVITLLKLTNSISSLHNFDFNGFLEQPQGMSTPGSRIHYHSNSITILDLSQSEQL